MRARARAGEKVSLAAFDTTRARSIKMIPIALPLGSGALVPIVLLRPSGALVRDLSMRVAASAPCVAALRPSSHSASSASASSAAACRAGVLHEQRYEVRLRWVAYRLRQRYARHRSYAGARALAWGYDVVLAAAAVAAALRVAAMVVAVVAAAAGAGGSWAG